MKLRPYPTSLNGNAMEADQFGFSVDQDGVPTAIQFRCRGPNVRPNGRQCSVNIVHGPANKEEHQHGWDGNREAPTITPSIGCDARCGWHGHIINGEISP